MLPSETMYHFLPSSTTIPTITLSSKVCMYICYKYVISFYRYWSLSMYVQCTPHSTKDSGFLSAWMSQQFHTRKLDSVSNSVFYLDECALIEQSVGRAPTFYTTNYHPAIPFLTLLIKTQESANILSNETTLVFKPH